MSRFNVEKFRSQFPLLKSKSNNTDLIYFDNAATTQKPQCVIDSYKTYFQETNANVHRSSHHLSNISTSAFEHSRAQVKEFINAIHVEEIIWTKGTTESINLIAQSLGELILNAGDEILLTQSEHHANIVPWQIIADKKSVIIKVVPLTDAGLIDTHALQLLISPKTKIFSFAHISNVIGKINPIHQIVELCNKHNIISVIDGAQAIAHEVIDVQSINCHFYLFSAHKMYGPTGVGVLYGKRDLLNKMPPYQTGGEMISSVSFTQTTFNSLPYKFEAGTPNIAGIIAFGATIKFIRSSIMEILISYEKDLTEYCYRKLKEINDLTFVVEGIPNIPLFSFTVLNQHNHDIASYLNSYNIAVRAGEHCAMPLMEYLKCDGCVRIALTAYNTFSEIDKVIVILKGLLSDANSAPKHHLTTSSQNYCIQSYETVSLANCMLNSQNIIEKFSSLKSWDSRHREVMLLGKKYERLASQFIIDDNLIKGCESKVWLYFKLDNGMYNFFADSDAKVIRGLLTIVLAAYNHKTKEQIVAFDIDGYLNEIGLKNHLSPSRTNGLLMIIKRIKEIVS